MRPRFGTFSRILGIHPRRGGRVKGGAAKRQRYEFRSVRFHLPPEDDLDELAGTLKRTAPWHVARRRMSWTLAPSPARSAPNACGGGGSGNACSSGRRSGAPRRDCRRAARLKNHTMTSSAPTVLSSCPCHSRY